MSGPLVGALPLVEGWLSVYDAREICLVREVSSPSEAPEQVLAVPVVLSLAASAPSGGSQPLRGRSP